MKIHQYDRIFPLKRYYLVYAGLGGIIFYAILFTSFSHTERKALYDQYVENLTGKARMLYRNIDRNFLMVNQIDLEDIGKDDKSYQEQLREEIDGVIRTVFNPAKVKVFNNEGIVLYDHGDKANMGKPYDSSHEVGFITALNGYPAAKVERDDNNKRYMEIYLPIYDTRAQGVVGILELYEDVSRFEEQVYLALKQALILPTVIFIAFNLVLFIFVAKADRIISLNTELLISLRRNMEKYLSSSAIDAIYNAVTFKKELFQGSRQNIVMFFSDIRGFTAYSESNEPEVVVRSLNSIFELKADIIHAHSGVIDKFVGDQIMAIFPLENAEPATVAALEIIEKIQKDPGMVFEIGISLHAGDTVVGSIGTKDRRDYTAIGDTVNAGAWLCGVRSGRSYYQLRHF